MGIDLDIIEFIAESCELCELHSDRIKPVFAKGDKTGKIMLVGMCPGPDENEVGVPFVGKAGVTLDELIARAFYRKPGEYDGVYITNLVKCFVKPGIQLKQDWMSVCLQYFFAQISAIKPSRLVLLGSDVSRFLLNSEEKIGALRGKITQYQGIKTVCTYHPSYIARSGGKTSKDFDTVVSDFRLITGS